MEDTYYPDSPLDYSTSPQQSPDLEPSPDRDMLEIHGPSGASLDASFSDQEEQTHKQKVGASTNLLVSLCLAEQYGENCERSPAVMDHSTALLESISLHSELAQVTELQEIRRNANGKKNPFPIESFVSLILGAEEVSKQVARTGVATVAIMILSCSTIPESLESNIAEKVRSIIVSHQLSRYKQKNTCSASLIHINFSISHFVTLNEWPPVLKPENLKAKLWTCSRHHKWLNSQESCSITSACDCTIMCCQAPDGSCSMECHVNCNTDHLDCRLSKKLLEVFHTIQPPLVSSSSDDIVTIDTDTDNDDDQTAAPTNNSNRLSEDCLPSSNVWYGINPRPDTSYGINPRPDALTPRTIYVYH